MSHRDKAEELSNRPYSVIVRRELTTSGAVTYVANNPELEYCMSHGKDAPEAIRNLHEARRLFIEDLLDSDLPVPLPRPLLNNRYPEQPPKINVVQIELEPAVPMSENLRDLHLHIV